MDRNKITVLFILGLFALFAFPLLSEAEDGLEGSIEVGGALTDLDSKSFKYGEYTGVNDDSIYFAGNVDLSYNRNAFFLDLRTDNIGLDNRSLYLETGRYGRYKLFLEYDELPKLISNNSQTILNGAGTNSLTLPSGWVRGNQTTNLTNLTSSKKDIELRTDRKAYGAGFSSSFSDFDFKISFKKEEKEGTKSIGGTIGNSGGTTRSIVLPEPVDYTTDELKATLAYSGETSQIELGYYLSQFVNGNNSLTWKTAYDMAAGFSDPTTALISLPPDNTHNKLSLTGGINLPLASRLSFIGEYGIMEQNDTLFPYSNNPSSTITTPLPRTTADAEIDVTHFGLNLSSKPLPKLGLNLKYKYYETDNKAPRDLFLYVNNDTGGAQTTVTAINGEALYNLPYDYTQNKATIDASYYLFSGTTIKIGYDHDIIDRDYREIEETRENTYRTHFNSSLSSFASAGVKYSYAERRAKGNYEESLIYDAYHTQEYVAAQQAAGTAFDNNPLLRKYDIADRDRTKYGADVTLFIIPDATVGLYYSYMQNDYYGSILGLQKDENKNYTVDITYAPADFISTYTYYTREELKSKQAKNTTVGVGYQYENYKSDDWATDGFDIASTILANVLTLSGSVPDYEAHHAMLTVAYNW